MQLLVETFPSLASLKNFIKVPEVRVPATSIVVPQQLLFRDEKYTDENIQILNVPSPSEPVPHEKSLEWLSSTAKSIVEERVLPLGSQDPLYALHRSFLYIGFMYTDLYRIVKQTLRASGSNLTREHMVNVFAQNC